MSDNNLSAYDTPASELIKFSIDRQTPLTKILVKDLVDDHRFFTIQDVLKQYTLPSSLKDAVSNILSMNPSITTEDILFAWYNIDSNLSIDELNRYYYDILNYISKEPTKKSTKFENMKRFENQKTNLEDSYKEQLRPTQILYDRIVSDQEIFKQLEEMIKKDVGRTPFNLKSTAIGFSPSWSGQEPEVEDGVDIFNSMKPSRTVPCVLYMNDAGNIFTRLFTETNETLDYDNIIPKKEKITQKNTIYLTLWMNENLNVKGTKDSYQLVVYDLYNNIISFDIPPKEKSKLVNDKQILSDRLKAVFPTMDFGAEKELKRKGSFQLWGNDIKYDETLIRYQLTAARPDDLINNSLYIDEAYSIMALKRNFDFYYYPYRLNSTGFELIDELNKPIRLELKPRQFEGDTAVVTVIDSTTGGISTKQYPKGTYFVEFSIEQSTDLRVIKSFEKIFPLLFSALVGLPVDPVDEDVYTTPILEQIWRKVSNTTANSYIDGSGGRGTKSRIKQLAQRAPDIFISDYARVCVSDRQPTIIDNENDPRAVNKKIMVFPRLQPNYMFICEHESKPFPGLVSNYPSHSNYVKYPLLPCCFSDDQETTSKYKTYMTGKAMIRPTAKADKTISTNKILSEGRVGSFAPVLMKVLSNYKNQNDEFIRFGVVRDPNSFLHCLCRALNYQGYKDKKDDEKITLVMNTREMVAKETNPAMLKQELYDYSYDKIKESLFNNELFLDPALFYRAYEEFFRVNIYVFILKDDGKSGNIETPRCRMFHVRPKRKYNKTICIYKSMGAESDGLEYPQCEILARSEENKSINQKIYTLVFDDKMNDYCYDILLTKTKSTIMIDEQTARQNFYSRIDYESTLPIQPTSQFIDSNGKTRVFNFGNSFSMIIPPTQPLNIPHQDEIIESEYTEIIKYFKDKPTGSYYDKGLWYRIGDLEHGILIPLKPTNKIKQYPQYNYEILPKLTSNVSMTMRQRLLTKNINLFTFLIKWLFDISDLKTDEFARLYITINKSPVPDSANFYDFSRLERKLPRTTDIKVALDHLTAFTSRFVMNGKVLLYDEEFYNKIVEYIRNYEITRPSKFEIKYYIDLYYRSETDFQEQPDSKIFMSFDDMLAWKESMYISKDYQHYFSVLHDIPIKKKFEQSPFIYRDQHNRLYLVQNTIDYQSAITVANYWSKDRINLGYSPVNMIKETDKNIIVYGYDNNMRIVPITSIDGSDGQCNVFLYGSIFDYRDVDRVKNYAALLQLN